MLSFQYYQKLFMIVNKHAKERTAETKKQLIEERRAHLKSGDEASYKESVMASIKADEAGF